jgi:hypothetical protein
MVSEAIAVAGFVNAAITVLQSDRQSGGRASTSPLFIGSWRYRLGRYEIQSHHRPRPRRISSQASSECPRRPYDGIEIRDIRVGDGCCHTSRRLRRSARVVNCLDHAVRMMPSAMTA